jgi:hypothetical protein
MLYEKLALWVSAAGRDRDHRSTDAQHVYCYLTRNLS